MAGGVSASPTPPSPQVRQLGQGGHERPSSPTAGHAQLHVFALKPAFHPRFRAGLAEGVAASSPHAGAARGGPASTLTNSSSIGADALWSDPDLWKGCPRYQQHDRAFHLEEDAQPQAGALRGCGARRESLRIQATRRFTCRAAWQVGRRRTSRRRHRARRTWAACAWRCALSTRSTWRPATRCQSASGRPAAPPPPANRSTRRVEGSGRTRSGGAWQRRGSCRLCCSGCRCVGGRQRPTDALTRAVHTACVIDGTCIPVRDDAGGGPFR